VNHNPNPGVSPFGSRPRWKIFIRRSSGPSMHLKSLIDVCWRSPIVVLGSSGMWDAALIEAKIRGNVTYGIKHHVGGSPVTLARRICERGLIALHRRFRV
jgi:hypothetical protein